MTGQTTVWKQQFFSWLHEDACLSGAAQAPLMKPVSPLMVPDDDELSDCLYYSSQPKVNN